MRAYTAKELSEIFGLSKESIYKYMERKEIPSLKTGKRSYLVSEKDLFDVLDSNPRMLYLVCQNSGEKNRKFLAEYKKQRSYEDVYHLTDIAYICHMTNSWARGLRERGKLSGPYVRETELIKFLKRHSDAVDRMIEKSCNIPACEVMRVRLLNRLKKEKWI